MIIDSSTEREEITVAIQKKTLNSKKSSSTKSTSKIKSAPAPSSKLKTAAKVLY